jgi:hypothetical protein
VAASIHQRLLNLSRSRREDFNLILTHYTIERLLYRLARSEYAQRFVLKGALLFAIWTGRLHRPTRDLDLLGYGDSLAERLTELFKRVCLVSVEADGLANLIDEEARAQGVKLLLTIPREVMEQQAVEKGDIRFYELAYLEAEVKPARQKRAYTVTLTDFAIPNDELIPPEVRAKIKKWSDYLDYWASRPGTARKCLRLNVYRRAERASAMAAIKQSGMLKPEAR